MNIKHIPHMQYWEKLIAQYNTPMPAVHAKNIIDEAIRKECKKKWNNAPHYKHRKLFYSGPKKYSQAYSKAI